MLGDGNPSTDTIDAEQEVLDEKDQALLDKLDRFTVLQAQYEGNRVQAARKTEADSGRGSSCCEERGRAVGEGETGEAEARERAEGNQGAGSAAEGRRKRGGVLTPPFF
jgi:hypothetical protein